MSLSAYIYNWTLNGNSVTASALIDNYVRDIIKFDGYSPFFDCEYNAIIFNELENKMYEYCSAFPMSSHLSTSILSIKNYMRIRCTSKKSYDIVVQWMKRKGYISKCYIYKDPFIMFLGERNLCISGMYVIEDSYYTDKAIITRFTDCHMDDTIMYKPNVLCFDIESRFHSGKFSTASRMEDSIICIGVAIRGLINKNIILTIQEYTLVKNANVIHFNTELDMIEYFLSMIDMYDISCVTCYNGYDYDLKYIATRLGIHFRHPISGIDLEQVVSPVEYNKNRVAYIIKKEDCIVLDVYEFIKKSSKSVTNKLDDVASYYLGVGKSGDFGQLYNEYRKTKDIRIMNTILEYCMNDVDITYRLFEKFGIWESIMSLSSVSYYYPWKYLLTGQSGKVENAFTVACLHRHAIFDTHYKGEQRETYTGALNMAKPGMYTNVSIEIDAASHYPRAAILVNACQSTNVANDDPRGELSICINENTGERTSFITSEEGILPSLMIEWMEARAKCKARIKELTKEGKDSYVMDRLQYAYKILVNSAYGTVGAKTVSSMYNYYVASAITAKGREIIRAAEDTAEHNGYRVLYIDTDSLIILFSKDDTIDTARNKALKLSDEIASKFKSVRGYRPCFEIKSIYERLIILSSKNYITLVDDKVHFLGGDAMKRDRCDYARRTYKALGELVIRGATSNDVRIYIEKVINDLKYNLIPLDDLIIRIKVTADSLRMKTNSIQKRIATQMTEEGIELDPVSKVNILYAVPIDHYPDKIKKNEDCSVPMFSYDSNTDRIFWEYYVIKQLIPNFDKLLNITHPMINMSLILELIMSKP